MTDTSDLATMRLAAESATATEQLAQLAKQHHDSQPESERPLTQEQVEQRLIALKKSFDEANRPQPDSTTGLQPPQPFETTTWPKRTVADKLDVAAHLTDLGVPAEGVKNIIAGNPYSKADVAAARQWKRSLLQDPHGELAQLLAKRDPEATRVLIGMSHIIATAEDAK